MSKQFRESELKIIQAALERFLVQKEKELENNLYSDLNNTNDLIAETGTLLNKVVFRNRQTTNGAPDTL